MSTQHHSVVEGGKRKIEAKNMKEFEQFPIPFYYFFLTLSPKLLTIYARDFIYNVQSAFINLSFFLWQQICVRWNECEKKNWEQK